jgi:plasmid stabilization system protein ParE
MAYTLIWSRAALEDIDGIAEYISKDSLYHAQQVVERLLELGESLPEHPKLGRMVPELENSLVRERFVYSYRLIYELHDTAIHILAVIHGKRLLEVR